MPETNDQMGLTPSNPGGTPLINIPLPGGINIAEMIGRCRVQSYPTPTEIMMTPEPTHKPGVIKLTKEWKKEIWKEKKAGTAQEKFEALKTLLERIANEHYSKPVEVTYQPDLPSCCYNMASNRIAINSSLSIISAMHELAHHLFGPSEKKACRWSVHLFKKTFPRAYANLEWSGHCLVRRVESHT